MTCDLCNGKGWVTSPPSDAFPDPCRICAGAGRLSIGKMARLLKEDPGTLSRIYYHPTRPREVTAFRIIDKVNALLDP